MRPPALALPALEVAVGGRRAALARRELIRVHAKAHRAARLTPLGARVEEDLVQSLFLSLPAHPHRTGDDQHPYSRSDVLAPDHVRRGAQVLDAPVGAGAEEHRVHADVAQRRAGLEAHVRQRLLRGHALVVVPDLLGVGDGRAQRQALPRVRAPRDERRELVRVDVHFGVESRVVVGAQRLPVLDGSVPVRAGRCVRAALDVAESRLVRCDHAGARARLDRHVADRHARFHREVLDRAAAVLEHIALSATGSDLRDDREDDVLRRDAGLERAVDVDGHRLERTQRQRLRRHHVLDLGRADAERQRAERTVRGRVTVAAHHGHSGLREAELRAHHVDDALFEVTHRVQPHAELRAVAAKRLDLQARHGVRDRLVDVDGRDVVVLGGDRQVGPAQLAVRKAQAVERLGAGDFVEQMEVDVEQVRLRATAVAHNVCLPHLLRERAAHRDISHIMDAPTDLDFSLSGKLVSACGTA